MTRIITCVSGKGGVGKTTIAINLAAALNYFGKTVTLVDANLTTANIGLHLGVPTVPIHLHHVLKGKKQMHEAVYRHKSGMRVVPSSIALYELKGLNPSRLKSAVSELRGSCDFVIIDGAPGLGREAINAIKTSDEVLVVTNPEIPAVTDALKTLRLCKDFGKKVLGVVVNKTNVKNPDMDLENIQSMLESPIIGVVPEDRKVKYSLDSKDAVVHVFPDSAASVYCKRIVAELLGLDYKGKIADEPKGLGGFILRIFGFR